MTESEAIKELQENIDLPFGVTVSDEASRMSINALEKQIAKKPDECEDRYYACPVCDNILLHKWIRYPAKLMPKTEGLPHCMSCGQAIDWSEE